MAIGENRYKNSTNLEPIAQAITSMGQSANKKDKPDVLANKIKAISSDATGTEAEMLVGKTFYAAGQKKTGSMVNRGAWTNRLGINSKIVIPAGYHNGSGYVDQSITTKGAQIYTPSTVNQVISAGQYLSGAQTIAGDPNLVAGNIAKGKTIFGVTGTYNLPTGTRYFIVRNGYYRIANSSLVKLPNASAPRFFSTVTEGAHASSSDTEFDLLISDLSSGNGMYAGMFSQPMIINKTYTSLVVDIRKYKDYWNQIWIGLVPTGNINNITLADFTNKVINSSKFAAITALQDSSGLYTLNVSNLSGTFYIILGTDYRPGVSSYAYSIYLRDIFFEV